MDDLERGRIEDRQIQARGLWAGLTALTALIDAQAMRIGATGEHMKAAAELSARLRDDAADISAALDPSEISGRKGAA